jgi:hypothetical protein
LEATAPKQETIEVAFPGHRLEFRVVLDYTEAIKLRRGAQAFVASFPGIRSTPEWSQFAKTDDEVLALAHYFANTLVAAYVGDEKMAAGAVNTHTFLQIAKERANAFDQIRDEINVGQFAILAKGEDEAVAAAKKE